MRVKNVFERRRKVVVAKGETMLENREGNDYGWMYRSQFFLLFLSTLTKLKKKKQKNSKVELQMCIPAVHFRKRILVGGDEIENFFRTSKRGRDGGGEGGGGEREKGKIHSVFNLLSK